MKQELDEVRTLAIKLYEAGQKEKRTQQKHIWGNDRNRTWRDLPSESVAVWDAIALCAYDELCGDGKCQAKTQERFNHLPDRCKFKALPNSKFCKRHQKWHNAELRHPAAE